MSITIRNAPCMRCRLLLSDHVEGKCVWQSTNYTPFPDAQLIDRMPWQFGEAPWILDFRRWRHRPEAYEISLVKPGKKEAADGCIRKFSWLCGQVTDERFDNSKQQLI